MTFSNEELRDLVDEKDGTVDARIYTDPEIYQMELERVFKQTWLCLGHETQIPNAHDFINGYMAEDPIIVVRQPDGSIRAFLNQCRHRGMPVNPYDNGCSRVFVCPYHGWTFDSSGALVNVPMEDTAYHNCLEKEKFGLISVPRVETYKGLIFGNWNKNAPSLIDYLGEATFYMDTLFDRSPSGMEVIGGVHKWTIPCNWKLAAEQFASDLYHVALTHSGTITALTPDDLPIDQRDFAVNEGLQFRATKGGHGSGFYLRDEANLIIGAIVGEAGGRYFNGEGQTKAVANLGDIRAKKMGSQHMTVFPTLSFLPGINTVRVWHPRGPEEIEIWSFVIVPKDAPAEVKESYRRGVSQTFSPSGIFEQDDGENWAMVQQTLRGAMARSTRFNIQMGLGRAVKNHPDFPGIINNAYSEEAARGFYSEWARLMATEEAHKKPKKGGMA